MPLRQDNHIAQISKRLNQKGISCSWTWVSAKIGYGKYDEEIEAGIRQMMEDNGIALDPIYTGKAYTGMLRWLKKQGEGMEHVLFLHTGGLPLYFDYLNSKVKEVRQ